MATRLFKTGVTIDELMKHFEAKMLNGEVKKDTPIYVASDEEQNTVYKGIYVDTYSDCLILAGLSGRELEDDDDMAPSIVPIINKK